VNQVIDIQLHHKQKLSKQGTTSELIYIHEHQNGLYLYIENELSTHLSRQHSCGIKMSESGGRGRVSQIICGHINSLHRGDGSLLGGCNSLL
jgi:hypothetical protein